MVQIGQSQLIYGDMTKHVREDISQRKLIQHLMLKNPAWNNHIFQTINWDTFKAHPQKQTATRATNIIKLVHGWQNDGCRKGLFYDIQEDTMCPTGCGETELRQHCMNCVSPSLRVSYTQFRIAFLQVNTNVHTAKTIINALSHILICIRKDE